MIDGADADRLQAGDGPSPRSPGSWLYGGPGNDILIGGALTTGQSAGEGGDDILLGGMGPDRLYGRAGNDILDGGEGADDLDGGLGIDLAIGLSRDDRATGIESQRISISH